MVDEADRLRVVHDDEVVRVGVDLFRVEPLVARKACALLAREPARVALQRVVDRLRHVEELVRAVDDPPLDLEAGVLHERHERVLDLGNAPAERGGGKPEHAPPGERLRQPADLVHQAAGRDGRVVRERLVAGVDELQHLERTPRPARLLPVSASPSVS